MAQSHRSEDALAKKMDSCVADTIIKIGGGLATGVVFSLFLFKRKSWPIVFGVGVGAGMGTSNCQYKLNVPYLVRADRVKVDKELSGENLNANSSPVEATL